MLVADYNGTSVPDKPEYKDVTKDQATEQLRPIYLNPANKDSTQTQQQIWRYYDKNMSGGEPKQLKDAAVIEVSGFQITLKIPVVKFNDGSAKLLVERTGAALRGADQGFLYKKATGSKEVPI